MTLPRLNEHLDRREGQYRDRVNKKEQVTDDLIQHHFSHLKSLENKEQGQDREKGEGEDQVHSVSFIRVSSIRVDFGQYSRFWGN